MVHNMTSREHIVDLLLQIDTDLLKAAKILYPDIFYAPFDPIHFRMRDVIQARYQKKALAAPRGIGKTSLANLVLPTVKALMGHKRYIVPISATADLAIQQSENLKYQLTKNENILRLFGDVRTSQWSKDMWVIETPEHEVCIFPRGAGQQVRGQNWRGFRPDLIIFDDLEKSDRVNNDKIRQDNWEWVNADVSKSIDPRSRSWEMMFIGTVLHYDSVLMRVLEDPSWHSSVFEICDDDFNSNAPSLYSKEDLKRLYQEHLEQGILDVFYREMRNIPAATGEHQAFSSEFFRYYDEDFIGQNNLETLIIIDPAKTASMKSADSAIVVVTLDMKKHKVYVRDVISGKFHPDELYNAVTDAVLAYRAGLVAVEVTGLHEFVLYPLKNHLKRRSVFVEVMELHARGGVNESGKIARVRSLSPMYRQGLIYHNKNTCVGLESQLLQFPNAKKWDIMDALGYLPEILETAERYMIWYVESEQGITPREAVEAEYLQLVDDVFPEQRSNWRKF